MLQRIAPSMIAVFIVLMLLAVTAYDIYKATFLAY